MKAKIDFEKIDFLLKYSRDLDANCGINLTFSNIPSGDVIESYDYMRSNYNLDYESLKEPDDVSKNYIAFYSIGMFNLLILGETNF